MQVYKNTRCAKKFTTSHERKNFLYTSSCDYTERALRCYAAGGVSVLCKYAGAKVAVFRPIIRQ